jgi:hypothetical protein
LLDRERQAHFKDVSLFAFIPLCTFLKRQWTASSAATRPKSNADSVSRPSIAGANVNRATGKRPTDTFAQVSLGPRAGYQEEGREDRGEDAKARVEAEAEGGAGASVKVEVEVEVSVEAGAEARDGAGAEAGEGARAEAGEGARAEAEAGVGAGAGEEDVEEAPRDGSRRDRDDSPNVSRAENVVENAGSTSRNA